MRTQITTNDGAVIRVSARAAARYMRMGVVREVEGVMLAGVLPNDSVARRSRRIDAEDSHTVTRTGMLYEHHMRRCLGWGGVGPSR